MKGPFLFLNMDRVLDDNVKFCCPIRYNYDGMVAIYILHMYIISIEDAHLKKYTGEITWVCDWFLRYCRK